MPTLLPLRPILAASVVLLAGCNAMTKVLPTWLEPYRPDVQQGNVVTKEMVEQLAPGMTKDQVRFLLGTPALASVFHQERWDYVYLLKRGVGSEVQSRRLTVYFQDNRLERFSSDDMPPEALADNLILGRKPKAAATPPPKDAEPLRTREVDPRTDVEIITPTSPPIGF